MYKRVITSDSGDNCLKIRPSPVVDFGKFDGFGIGFGLQIGAGGCCGKTFRTIRTLTVNTNLTSYCSVQLSKGKITPMIVVCQ